MSANGPSESRKRPESADIMIGQRLKEYRTRRKMSQEKLGEHLGITFQQIQKYERGANRISAGRLFEMARVLDVEPAQFYDGLGSAVLGGVGFLREPDASYSSQSVDPAEFQLALAFRKITDPAVRQTVLDLVRSLGDRAGPQAGSGEENGGGSPPSGGPATRAPAPRQLAE